MNHPLPEAFIEPRAELLEAEMVADAAMKLCLRHSGLSEVPLPVPVETWIESPFGIDYGFETMPHREDGMMLGYYSPSQHLIRLNEMIADSDRSVRWIAAHELGHALLLAGKPTDEIKASYSYDPAWNYLSLSERQADRFAASFLMPPKELVRALFGLCDQHGLSRASTLITLLGDSKQATRLWAETFVPGLAVLFDIPVARVIYRLLDLRMADGGAPLLLVRHVSRFENMSLG